MIVFNCIKNTKQCYFNSLPLSSSIYHKLTQATNQPFLNQANLNSVYAFPTKLFKKNIILYKAKDNQY